MLGAQGGAQLLDRASHVRTRKPSRPTAGLHLDQRPPPPNGPSKWSRCAYFSGNSTHSAISLGWRRGLPSAKTLDMRAFLALRQFPRLAGRGAARVCRACVYKTRRRRAIDFSPLCAFKSERVAIWQSTRRQVANDCHFTCCFHRLLCQPPLKFGKVAKNSAPGGAHIGYSLWR